MAIACVRPVIVAGCARRVCSSQRAALAGLDPAGTGSGRLGSSDAGEFVLVDGRDAPGAGGLGRGMGELAPARGGLVDAFGSRGVLVTLASGSPRSDDAAGAAVAGVWACNGVATANKAARQDSR
jgi:hypothetical protein